MKVSELNALLNKIAPYKTAYDFDNVGLLLGDSSRKVEKIMLALDVSPEVVEQAVAAKVQLIVAHHPLIFKALKNITTDTPTGRMIIRLLENNIAVIAMHTNLDIAMGGVNDVLAELAGLQDIKVVMDGCRKDFVKLSLFVPSTHTQQIIELLDSLQIEVFGNYQSCSFTTSGTGRFKPIAGAQPFIGTQQELCSVQEDKVELILPKVRITEVLAQVEAVHPYEQMAYDVFEVTEPCLSQGILRLGRLPAPIPAGELAKQLKSNLGLEYVLLNSPHKQIATLAVCGGAGAEFVELAKRNGADALLTGDVKYHEAQNAKHLDLALMAIGHQESEQPVILALANKLKAQAALADIEIIIAKQDQILYCI